MSSEQIHLSQSLSFSLSWFLPIVTSRSVTQQCGYGDRWTNRGWSQLAEAGEWRKPRFTSARLPSGAPPAWASRPFNPVSVSFRVWVLMVFMQTWFENLQFNRQMPPVKAGKGLWLIPGSSCAKVLADSTLFLWGCCASICGFSL